tara:strand:- start:1356 stop:1541 length:186 start_codon:yes stop_codon:yes gene_type:complete
LFSIETRKNPALPQIFVRYLSVWQLVCVIVAHAGQLLSRTLKHRVEHGKNSGRRTPKMDEG